MFGNGSDKIVAEAINQKQQREMGWKGNIGVSELNYDKTFILQFDICREKAYLLLCFRRERKKEKERGGAYLLFSIWRPMEGRR